MARPSGKLAAPLERLKALQEGGRRVFRSRELTRAHRERLVAAGFLLEAMKGWLVSSGPEIRPDDPAPWLASFREFVAAYCAARFGTDWHLSPEQSLLLHAGDTEVPKRVVVHAPRGGNNAVELPFGTSLYDLRQARMPPEADLLERDGLRFLAPEAALVRAPEAFFARRPAEAQAALAGIRDASGILRRLVEGGHAAAAGRLAGAFRRAGRGEAADGILDAMGRAGHRVRETDPFEPNRAPGLASRTQAPIVERLGALWAAMREPAVAAFPDAPGLPGDPGAYMSLVDGLYRDDAFHSLSIEGHRVTPELVDGTRADDWTPDGRGADSPGRDELAARGYWQAFRLVRAAVAGIVGGDGAAALAGKSHPDWYRALFQPFVDMGAARGFDLSGYRNHAVLLRGSRHAPPRPEAVRDAMPALFELLAGEPQPSARAVLGHWLFSYVHPYPDGNGRMARFVMNAMLASGGYPWTVIRVEGRNAYMAALESASVEQDVEPFARFLAERVQKAHEAGARGAGIGDRNQ